MLPRLIVGLGNPKASYDDTRHNVGKRFIEWLNNDPSLPGPVKARTLSSYMNESGPAVQTLMKKDGVSPSDVLVVVDDFMIPFGTLRLRPQGSSGGHNGLKSIIEALGTDEFPRLRVGIGPVPEGQDPADFVLKPFTKTETKTLPEIFERIKQGLVILHEHDYQKAMTAMNQTNE